MGVILNITFSKVNKKFIKSADEVTIPKSRREGRVMKRVSELSARAGFQQFLSGLADFLRVGVYQFAHAVLLGWVFVVSRPVLAQGTIEAPQPISSGAATECRYIGDANVGELVLDLQFQGSIKPVCNLIDLFPPVSSDAETMGDDSPEDSPSSAAREQPRDNRYYINLDSHPGALMLVVVLAWAGATALGGVVGYMIAELFFWHLSGLLPSIMGALGDGLRWARSRLGKD